MTFMLLGHEGRFKLTWRRLLFEHLHSQDVTPQNPMGESMQGTGTGTGNTNHNVSRVPAINQDN